MRVQTRGPQKAMATPETKISTLNTARQVCVRAHARCVLKKYYRVASRKPAATTHVHNLVPLLRCHCRLRFCEHKYARAQLKKRTTHLEIDVGISQGATGYGITTDTDGKNRSNCLEQIEKHGFRDVLRQISTIEGGIGLATGWRLC